MKLKIGSALLLGAVGLVLRAGKFVLKIKISQVKKKKEKFLRKQGVLHQKVNNCGLKCHTERWGKKERLERGEQGKKEHFAGWKDNFIFPSHSVTPVFSPTPPYSCQALPVPL